MLCHFHHEVAVAGYKMYNFICSHLAKQRHNTNSSAPCSRYGLYNPSSTELLSPGPVRIIIFMIMFNDNRD
jgi:hypothetical protein